MLKHILRKCIPILISITAALGLCACDPPSTPNTSQSQQHVLDLSNSWGMTYLAAGLNHDFDPNGCCPAMYQVMPHASGSTLTGWTDFSTYNGVTIFLRNASTTVPIRLVNEHTGSTLSNRFKLPRGQDILIPPGEIVSLTRDDGTDPQRWMVLFEPNIRHVRTTTTPSRALGEAFQPNVNYSTIGCYAVRVQAALSLTTGARGRIELRSDSANPPTTVRGRVAAGVTGTLTDGLDLVDTSEATLCYEVPPGDYVLLQSVSETGTPTYSITAQTEQTL